MASTGSVIGAQMMNTAIKKNDNTAIMVA